MGNSSTLGTIVWTLNRFRLKTPGVQAFIYVVRRTGINHWKGCLALLLSIFLTKKILGVNTPQNRGVNISILPRQF